MSDDNSVEQPLNQAEAPVPKETLFVRYVSTATGHTYDEETVDHLADMLLIFYAAGGTVLGAICGCVISIAGLGPSPMPMRLLLVMPPVVFTGALMGCAAVLAILNLRGLVRWEKYVVKRTATLRRTSTSATQ